jgi:hypothetical protein
MDQMMNRECKKDTQADTSIKRKRRKEIDTALQEHLNDASTFHTMYPEEFQFPPARFVWDGNGYNDTALQLLTFNDDERTLQEELNAEKAEGIDIHYVGALRTSIAHQPPLEIEVVHIILCKANADAKLDGKVLPWFLAEVMGKLINEEGLDMLNVCEYGTGVKGKHIPMLGDAVNPAKVRWQATFRGAELINGEMKERDEYRPNATSPHTIASSKEYQPVCSHVEASTVIWWNVRDKMLKKPEKKRKGQEVRKAVVISTSANQRVPWNMDSGPCHEDTPSKAAAPPNNKRRRLS